MAHTLEIDVPMLVDAMTRGLEFAAELDLVTGEIDLCPADPSWQDDVAEVGAHRVEVPRIDAPERYRWMRDFAAAIDEDDIRQQLEDVLDGRGAFGRFHRMLGRYPDIAAEWERQQAERVIAEARPWLESLDIGAVFRFAAPRASPTPPRGTRPARVGLVDLLLLGAPDGKTELLEGLIHRVFVAGSVSDARAVFKTVARELCEMHGIAWRNRFIEGRTRYEVGRFVVTVEGARVELAVGVSPALWQAFAGGSG